METKSIIIHVLLLLFTAGLGNVVYYGYKNNWSVKKYATGIVVVLVLIVALGAVGPSDSGEPVETPTTDEPTDTPTSTDEPTEEPTDTPTSTDEPTDNTTELSDREILEESSILTMEYNEHIELGYVVISDSETEIEYETTASNRSEILNTIGWTSGAYATIVENDSDAGSANVTVKGYYSGETAGTFTIEREWAEQYNSGEMSGEEYGLKVLNTLEANE